MIKMPPFIWTCDMMLRFRPFSYTKTCYLFSVFWQVRVQCKWINKELAQAEYPVKQIPLHHGYSLDAILLCGVKSTQMLQNCYSCRKEILASTARELVAIHGLDFYARIVSLGVMQSAAFARAWCWFILFFILITRWSKCCTFVMLYIYRWSLLTNPRFN